MQRPCVVQSLLHLTSRVRVQTAGLRRCSALGWHNRSSMNAVRTLQSRTLYDKLWDDHVVHVEDDGTTVLYIDRHLVHEVTSPQAYEGLRLAGRAPWRISSIVATADHNTPTTGWEQGYGGIDDPISKEQIVTLDSNIRSFGAAAYFPFLDKRQGIVHVMGPEQGATLPGMTVVCGDSHTSTHGAFGALAFGIGTSEVEHVLATQTLLTKKAGNMLVKVNGRLPIGCTAKDIVLSVIGRIGTAGGTGYAIEFAGDAIQALSMGKPSSTSGAVRLLHRLISLRKQRGPGASCARIPTRNSIASSNCGRKRSSRRSHGVRRLKW